MGRTLQDIAHLFSSVVWCLTQAKPLQNLVPTYKAVSEIFMFKYCLENGRFDLENVSKGQRIIYHFFQKNKINKVTKKYQRFFELKKMSEIWVKSPFFIFSKFSGAPIL